jgi:hypothetical protein
MVFPSPTLMGEGASLNGLLSPDGAAAFPLAAAPYTFSLPSSGLLRRALCGSMMPAWISLPFSACSKVFPGNPPQGW